MPFVYATLAVQAQQSVMLVKKTCQKRMLKFVSLELVIKYWFILLVTVRITGCAGRWD